MDNDFVYGLSENAVLLKKNYKPRTIVDNTLEIVDPVPNIHTLFVHFNSQFFYGALDSVEVKWSTRMTSCAGICRYSSLNKSCVIGLSEPLLKLRPRKDLVETLLHEMIHAYLFVTNNDRDRDGHGPIFQSHMRRINEMAGTNITIYHTFHNEVKFYQQHWWRCNGSCQSKPPYFGLVKRAMNRAPSKNDYWWTSHKLSCGGTFIKIKEPESYKKNRMPHKNGTPSKSDTIPKHGTMVKGDTSIKGGILTKGSTVTKGSYGSILSYIHPVGQNTQVSSGIKKIGNSSNNVHGFGTGGPSCSSPKSNTQTSKPPTFFFSGTLGGSNKHDPKKVSAQLPINVPKRNDNNEGQLLNYPVIADLENLEHVQCPICSKNISLELINNHMDVCTLKSENSSSIDSIVIIDDDDDDDDELDCPICNFRIKLKDAEKHVNRCLDAPSNNKKRKSVHISQDSPKCSKNKEHSSPTCSNERTDFDKPHSPPSCSKKSVNSVKHCFICNNVYNSTLMEHLDNCQNLDENCSIIDTSEEEDFKENISDNSNNQDYVEDSKELLSCPVCTEMISYIDINRHLDDCLLSH